MIAIFISCSVFYAYLLEICRLISGKSSSLKYTFSMECLTACIDVLNNSGVKTDPCRALIFTLNKTKLQRYIYMYICLFRLILNSLVFIWIFVPQFMYSMCSLAVSTQDSPAVEPRSNPGSGKILMSENLRLYTTSPVVMC